MDNKVYFSYNSKTLDQIIKDAKKSGSGDSELNSIKDRIASLFDDEINASQDTIKEIEKKYKECLSWKNEAQQKYHKARDTKDEMISELKKILVDGYTELYNTGKKISEVSENSLKEFKNFIHEVEMWDITDHECLFSNTLKPILRKFDSIYYDCYRKYYDCCGKYYDCWRKHYEAMYKSSNEERRARTLVEFFADEEIHIVNMWRDKYYEASNYCEDALNRKNRKQVMIKYMQEYKNVFMAALDMGICEYQRKNKATSVNKEEVCIPNIFDCIKKNDYKLFLRSFESGVDISLCNADGYNPLTLAVETGNNAMVQFMLDHNVDPSIKDRRGYNAFHTAVENQYRDICKMLLDVDPDLIQSNTDSGVSVKELADKRTFSKWIEQEIDNAI